MYSGFGNANNQLFQNTGYTLTGTGFPYRIIAGNQISTPIVFNAADNSMSITTTTSSTTPSSGALKVSGGVGIVGNLNVGGQLNVASPFTVNFSNTQYSANSTTGALLLVGGLSINSSNTANANATSYTAGGSITVNGGVSVGQDLYIGGIIDVQSGSNNINPIKLQSIQISSNYNNGSSTVIQSGNSSRTSTSFTPIQFSGWNDQANPKMSINSSDVSISLNIGFKALCTSNTIGNAIYTTAGNVGIGTTNPNAPLQFLSVNTNRKIVVYEDFNNDHQFLGFGSNLGILRYQVSSTITDNVWYAGVNSTTSNEIFRIKGVGNIIVPGTTNSVAITTGSLWNTNSVSINSSIATANVIAITAGNINFTGSLYQNGSLYTQSQWSGTSGTSIFYGSTGNVNVGIGTTNPNYTLDVAGFVRIQNTQDASNSTTAGLILSCGLAVSSTTDSSSFTQGGSLTIAGGASIGKTLCVGNYLNMGGAYSTFGGSFTAGNNVLTASNITGLLFPSANVRSFSVDLAISVSFSVGNNLYAKYIIEGLQSSSGWAIDETFIGDTTGISFSITNSGQLQYTSTNQVNWQSTTMRFGGTLLSVTGNYLPGVLNSTGNFNVSGILNIYSTVDSTTTSNGSLVVSGGAGITKSLSIGGNLNMNGNSYVFGGAFNANNGIITNSNVTGLLFPSTNYRSFTIIMGISISATASLYSQYTIEGIQKASGWFVYITTLGDNIDIVFTINNSGQLLYSSTTTYIGWTNTIFNYQATGISITGSNAPVILPTTGNQTITGSLTITNTSNTTTTSSGALIVSGGAGITNDLRVGGNIYGLPQIFIIEEQQTNGVNPSFYPSGSFQTRTLNTIITNTITGASLTANQFTLPIGVYRINAFCPNYGSYTKCTLYNITNSVNSIIGQSGYGNLTSVANILINGIITVTANNTFVIQQYWSSANSQMGGVPASSGLVEVYTHIEITKLL
jgi:hypothetical protein